MQNLTVKNNILFLAIILFFVSTNLYAQDDLLAMLDSVPAKSVPSLPAFKTTRIVNGHSVETVKAHHLDFRVTHHFGDIGGDNGGVHTMYGLDNATDIRIAFEYGITDKLTAVLAEAKFQKCLIFT